MGEGRGKIKNTCHKTLKQTYLFTKKKGCQYPHSFFLFLKIFKLLRGNDASK